MVYDAGMRREPVLSPATILKTVEQMFEATNLHAKQILSITHGVLGAVCAEQAGVAKIGRAAAAARGTSPKHGIKQFDGLLSNDKIDDDDAQRAHVAFILGSRKSIVASLDWTTYDADGHHRIALSLVTRHGRATPLIWKTVTDEELTNHRNDHEDDLLVRFRRLLPERITEVIILADRGFGDIKLYQLMRELKFHYAVRFRACIVVAAANGETAKAGEWVPSNGRARLLEGACVTGKRYKVGAVVAVKKRGMKEAWIIATSLPWSADRIIALYGRRFTIEENFRDEKDPRFGLGILNVRIKTTARRDRLMLILAIAMSFLTLLGAAGERLGLDRLLRANTVKRRTHSLFRQGREYLRGALGKLSDTPRRLRLAFLNAIAEHARSKAIFGDI